MLDGLESFVKRETEILKDRGYDISLFATKYKYSKDFEPRKDIPYFKPDPLALVAALLFSLVRSPVQTLSLLFESIKFRGVVELMLALTWLGSIRQFRPNLIHCAFGDRKFFVGYFLSRLTDIPLTVAIHAHEIYAQPNPNLFLRAIARASGVVTISRKNKKLLVERYRIEEDKIDVIKLSIDVDFWRYRPDIVKVLTVARFTERKGWDDLVVAAEKLGDGYHFYAAGFGDLDVEALIDAAGLGQRFTVFPKLNSQQLQLLMEACDIFCLPSKPNEREGSEGIPVVLMEAMSMGLPIVATSDGSIAELVDDIVVDPGNIEELVEAIKNCAGRIQGVKQKYISSPNRQKVCEEHGLENTELLDLFFQKYSV